MSIMIAILEAIRDRGTFNDWSKGENLEVLIRVMRGEVKDEKGNTLHASQIEGTIWDLMNFGAVIDQVEYHVSETLSLVGKPPETPLL